MGADNTKLPDGSYDVGWDVAVTIRGGEAVSYSSSWGGCTWYRIADECLYLADRARERVARFEAIARAALDRAAKEDSRG